MAHHSTILRQIVAFLPRHEFDALAKNHHRGQEFRSFNRWSQFMAMCIGQLSGRASLRDLVMNLAAQSSKLYPLGIEACSRASLTRVNEQQPPSLYEAYSKNSSSSAANSPPGTASSLTTAGCISSMPRLSIYASPFFHGPHSAKPRGSSNCMWGWMAMATCPNSWTSQTAKAMRVNGPKP